MKWPVNLRRVVARALWLGALVVILAGLFGMHGLGQHGAEMGPSHAGSLHMEDAEPVGTAAIAIPAVTVLQVPLGDGMGMDMSGAAMCLAVLLFTLLALVARMHASRAAPLLFLVTRPSRAPAASGREPDPPDLHVLSVQRC